MKTTAFLIMCIVLMVVVFLLWIFERRTTDVKKIIFITVLTALSILGRFIFAFLPGFKPVTAIVIITGIYFGAEGGFYCGALTALVTNFYFGQGSYTPFQMFTWGIIGVIAGIFGGLFRKNRVLLYVYAFFAGIIFSLLMDIYTVIWTFGSFNLTMYLTMLAASFVFTIEYAVSNIIFLVIFHKPIGKKIEHAINKYC